MKCWLPIKSFSSNIKDCGFQTIRSNGIKFLLLYTIVFENIKKTLNIIENDIYNVEPIDEYYPIIDKAPLGGDTALQLSKKEETIEKPHIESCKNSTSVEYKQQLIDDSLDDLI